MNWAPKQACPGDVIRVRLGGIYHYGIFASEAEVIQFGLPPIPQYRKPGEEITVCATDIDVFSCGQTVEVAQPQWKERLHRHSAAKTLRLARQRLGEGGYNLLHNNCEHFVYQCAYGKTICTQEDAVRQRWRNRPILDVYLAVIPQNATLETVYPPARQKYIQEAGDETLRQARYFAWKTLETAIGRSFDIPFSELRFKRERRGKWVCDRLHFSLSHTKGVVGAAVSNGEVGVDVEDIQAFSQKYGSPETLEAMARRAMTPEELPNAGDPESFLRLWTKKECLFKGGKEAHFDPLSIDTRSEKTQTRVLENLPLCVSVCGAHLNYVRYYLVSEGAIKVLLPGAFRNGNDGL